MCRVSTRQTPREQRGSRSMSHREEIDRFGVLGAHFFHGPPPEEAVRTEHRSITRETEGNAHILDLTRDLQDLVAGSGLATGQITVMVVGSTAALTTTEFEPGLVERDLAAALERIAPRDAPYLHEETWGDDNGHSHVRASLIGPSLALPIVEGRVPLGTWQQVILVDLDTRPRRREVVVTLLGD